MAAYEATDATVIYEVNLFVDEEHSESYIKWLVPHMEEMLSIDGFVNATLATSEPLDTVLDLVTARRSCVAEATDEHLFIPIHRAGALAL